MTANPQPQPQPGSATKEDKRDDTASSIDEESQAYWTRTVSAMPPMTPEEIATVAVILRRIDARRGQQPRP